MKRDADKLISRICDEIQHLGQIYDTKKVYSDLLTVSAVCVSNSTCGNWFIERETLYKNTMKRYRPEHRKVFADMFELLVKIFDLSYTYYNDIFCKIADVLSVRRRDLKQNFSPESVGNIMGRIAVMELEKQIEKNGYASVSDSTCGTGTLILKYAEELSLKYNPHTQMCATLVDKDFNCVCAAYLQLSFYGIPAVVIHGDILKAEEISRWYTPAYVLDRWVWRCKCAIVDGFIQDDEMLKMASEPIYAAIKKLKLLEKREENEQC